MITAPLETFAPAPLLALINGASYWVDISLAVLLAISCVLVGVAVLRPSTRKRWLVAAGAVAFCGFISDEFIYRHYWDGMCAHAGYYFNGVQQETLRPLPKDYHFKFANGAMAWDGGLMAQSRQFESSKATVEEFGVWYYGGRADKYLRRYPFAFLGSHPPLLECSQVSK